MTTIIAVVREALRALEPSERGMRTDDYNRAVVVLIENAGDLADEVEKLRALTGWQGAELSKRMACQKCGLEPDSHSEIYPTVCPSCRRCYECAEPMCPTCGDATGTKQRAIDLLRENAELTESRNGYIELAGKWMDRLEQSEAEMDRARAEVERLRELAADRDAIWKQMKSAEEEAERLASERAQLREFVEQLRALVETAGVLMERCARDHNPHDCTRCEWHRAARAALSRPGDAPVVGGGTREGER